MNLQNKSIVLNVVLAIAVVVLGVRLVSGAEDAGESQTQEQAVLDSLAGANPYAKMLLKAPLAVVVCGDMDKVIEGGGRDFWIQDASAATENLLLAAHAMGLGAVWTGAYPSEERSKAISATLSLPDNLVPLNMIVIGYPAEHPQPKDKFKEENITFKR